ncbi:MAG: exopolyphosphatase [Acidimicrobiia bacterium]
MSRRAVIDIGTNSVRLLVAQSDSDSGMFEPLERLVRVTRLGEGVHDTHRLQPTAVQRTLDAVTEFCAQALALDAVIARVVTTSAVRDATDRDKLLDQIAVTAGCNPEILSGDAEAALAFTGATGDTLVSTYPAPYLVVDIGGGSTELVVGVSTPEQSISLDVGCVRITEMFLHSDPPLPEELSNAVGYVRDLLADVDRVMPRARTARTAIGVAGTIASVAMIEQGCMQYSRARIHGFALTREAVEEIFRTLATESAEERRHNPGLEVGRVDVIVGGLVILAAVFRHYGLDSLVYSESDLLDGLLLSTQV